MNVYFFQYLLCLLSEVAAGKKALKELINELKSLK